MATNKQYFDLHFLKVIDTLVYPGSNTGELFHILNDVKHVELDKTFFSDKANGFSARVGLNLNDNQQHSDKTSEKKEWSFNITLWSVYKTFDGGHDIYLAVQLKGATRSQSIPRNLSTERQAIDFFNNHYFEMLGPAVNQTISSIFALTSIFDGVPNAPMALYEKIKKSKFSLNKPSVKTK